MGDLVLRPITMAEMRQTFEWVREPWYVESFKGHAVTSFETHAEYFDMAVHRTRYWRESGEAFLAVFLKGVHIGNAGFKAMKCGRGELWYYLASSMRGKGLGVRLVAALVSYGAENYGLVSFSARVVRSNLASCRVLEEGGFRCIGEEHDPDFGCSMLKFEYGGLA